ncbi:hypothetical protein C1E23_04340 [Pseudoalteromonas phenolica]|uniref:Uncharacterized protein n=1 Tax=Pseudoalteromonas phenolica TaxID=161398 RepID=A0A4Q7ISZ4_9GAMM|nr:hypothetical protein C1E23_04340 [Pseudoalteromonas phenolica]
MDNFVDKDVNIQDVNFKIKKTALKPLILRGFNILRLNRNIKRNVEKLIYWRSLPLLLFTTLPKRADILPRFDQRSNKILYNFLI